MNKKKFLGFVLATIVIGSIVTSCKAHHELCPAYSKSESVDVNKAN